MKVVFLNKRLNVLNMSKYRLCSACKIMEEEEEEEEIKMCVFFFLNLLCAQEENRIPMG